MITEPLLRQLYFQEKLSMQQIAVRLGCSRNKVTYWMDVYGIRRRTISEAVYVKSNPSGDPFEVQELKTPEDRELFGMGIGLYWGEGTKSCGHAVRLGNTDPALLRVFIRFLTELFGVDKTRLRFGLQIFTDIDVVAALDYWAKQLVVEPAQFYKVTVTVSGSLGTYKKKSQWGVVTLHFNNKKLRDIIVGLLPG